MSNGNISHISGNAVPNQQDGSLEDYATDSTEIPSMENKKDTIKEKQPGDTETHQVKRLPSIGDHVIFDSRSEILSIESKEDLNNEKNLKDTETHQVKHPTSYVDTILHIFRGNIGTGLFAMGDAFKNGGIIFSPIMTVILGIVCVHAQHLLLDTSSELHRRMKRVNPPNYQETVRLAFENGPPSLRGLANTMGFLANTFLFITQIGFCCVYIVFIATNLKTMCDEAGVHMELSVHMIFVVIPILVFCMVRNLKRLTILSTVANVLMALGVGVVLYYASWDLPPVSDRDYITNWKQLPLYFGTAIYAFEGIGLVLPLKNEMRKPAQFQARLGVLNVGMVIVGSTFVVVGFLGYLQWGEHVAGSLTLNLPSDQVFSKVVQGLIAIAMLLTYPLQMYVPVDITWPTIKRKYGQKSPVLTELIYRSALVMLTFVLAETIPQLSLFISLVGAVSSTTLALMFPPILSLVTVYQFTGKLPVFSTAKNILIILLGLFIFVTGTYESISSIVSAFRAAYVEGPINDNL